MDALLSREMAAREAAQHEYHGAARVFRYRVWLVQGAGEDESTMFLANEVDVTPLDPSGYVLRLRDCWGGAPDQRLSKSVTAPVRLYVVEELSQPDYGPDSIIGEADGSAEA